MHKIFIMSRHRSHRPFRLQETAVPLFAIAGFVLSGLAFSNAHAAGLTGNAALTSDYVWRGSTQTQGDPAVQAGFKLSGDSGLYASVRASSVKFAPGTGASSEFDFSAGWGKNISENWALDANLLRYQYPGANVDLNWTELNGTLTYRGNYWLSLGYSNEAMGYDASGTYALVGAKFPLGERFRIEADAAHYFLNDAVVAKNGYSHGWVSAVWTLKAPLELRLTGHFTDANAEAIFGDNYASSRFEAALQTSF